MARVGLAGVWLENGLRNKVLAAAPAHRRIVAALPCVGVERSRVLAPVIGVAEVGVAVWILSGYAARRAALVQTLALVAMNGGALRWAPREIRSAPRLVLRSVGLLGLAWWMAGREARG